MEETSGVDRCESSRRGCRRPVKRCADPLDRIDRFGDRRRRCFAFDGRPLSHVTSATTSFNDRYGPRSTDRRRFESSMRGFSPSFGVIVGANDRITVEARTGGRSRAKVSQFPWRDFERETLGEPGRTEPSIVLRATKLTVRRKARTSNRLALFFGPTLSLAANTREVTADTFFARSMPNGKRVRKRTRVRVHARTRVSTSL